MIWGCVALIPVRDHKTHNISKHKIYNVSNKRLILNKSKTLSVIPECQEDEQEYLTPVKSNTLSHHIVENDIFQLSANDTVNESFTKRKNISGFGKTWKNVKQIVIDLIHFHHSEVKFIHKFISLP